MTGSRGRKRPGHNAPLTAEREPSVPAVVATPDLQELRCP